MEPISTILIAAAGYILRAVSKTKAAETAKEELVGGFWKWVRPLFIKDAPEIETNPDAPETEVKVQDRLLELVKDEAFYEELAKRVNALKQAGVKEKNIVKGNIERVKKIRIGDKEYSPNEVYDRKNIVEGDVKDADEFTLGDGN